jgi:hypothetical protein
MMARAAIGLPLFDPRDAPLEGRAILPVESNTTKRKKGIYWDHNRWRVRVYCRTLKTSINLSRHKTEARALRAWERARKLMREIDDTLIKKKQHSGLTPF